MATREGISEKHLLQAKNRFLFFKVASAVIAVAIVAIIPELVLNYVYHLRIALAFQWWTIGMMALLVMIETYWSGMVKIDPDNAMKYRVGVTILGVLNFLYLGWLFIIPTVLWAMFLVNILQMIITAACFIIAAKFGESHKIPLIKK